CAINWGYYFDYW
nr:immunoglobulin heavy chain junction region [Mus musculus]MBK4186362.1 immunoglobulin heavy chain junction region [Mus musculus]MBK4186363.1 immunoglobulin heavy chain junction region [Mus musculus]MBK4186365.1 immunoglobulin heavy chain junction region [Mus musculus]MBK4186366.1 immunoglobulin heavy chain junction region [Mus musculus]